MTFRGTMKLLMILFHAALVVALADSDNTKLENSRRNVLQTSDDDVNEHVTAPRGLSSSSSESSSSPSTGLDDSMIGFTMLQAFGDLLINGAKQGLFPGHIADREKNFFEKNEPYFTFTTLCVVAVILFCVIGAACGFFAYRHNTLPEKVSHNPHGGYHDNALTGLPNLNNSTPPGPYLGKPSVISQPPAYTSASTLPVHEIKIKNPYREAAVMAPRPGEILEARHLIRSNTSGSKLQDQLQGRLVPLEDEGRDNYGYESGGDRVQRSLQPSWDESPERHREPADVRISPVGGVLYPARSSRPRSPSEERLLLKPPVREQGRHSLYGVAMSEYFEKHDM